MNPNPAGLGASAAGTLRRFTPLAIMLALAVSSVWLAYYALFSSFLAHDDEGYMLLSVRFLLEDKVLYDKVFTPYGPVYFM